MFWKGRSHLIRFDAISQYDQKFSFRTYLMKDLLKLPLTKIHDLDILYKFLTCPLNHISCVETQLPNFYLQYQYDKKP